MSSLFCMIDDKHVPLYRILWIADVPHFCGAEDCLCEGQYEVRLEQGESLWTNREERDTVIAALERWHAGDDFDDVEGEEPWD
ncbi:MULTISPECIES: hypothetical protein [Blastopirellula]|uniref:Uncharacterized protein n=1 Tax=Blastopirellula marina DSM 3645 TaxID=314230 RepID=A3ZQ59_9BACT|nr:MULTISPECIES: hypothetical protein [Blastopirellula]EAQ81332.1 hypothetical protein DSM3645_23111 [Blastopirellula marina DSM 3645]UUO08655.1 hypothetical protein M4951_10130 [Blastopirellula sp. J2-11]